MNNNLWSPQRLRKEFSERPQIILMSGFPERGRDESWSLARVLTAAFSPSCIPRAMRACVCVCAHAHVYLLESPGRPHDGPLGFYCHLEMYPVPPLLAGACSLYTCMGAMPSSCASLCGEFTLWLPRTLRFIHTVVYSKMCWSCSPSALFRCMKVE